jgi:hypothetical protein
MSSKESSSKSLSALSKPSVEEEERGSNLVSIVLISWERKYSIAE